MRAGRLRAWAGLATLALLVAGPAQAQGVLPPPAGVTAPPPAPPMPLLDGGVPPPPDGHPADDHPEEAERSWLSGVFFTGEYLLLHPRRNALDYAVVSPDPNLTPGGTIQSLDWHTNSGFRVGAGYQLPGDAWQLGVTYTYLHSHDDRTVSAPPGGEAFATLTRGGGVDEVQTAAGSTNLDFNVIDLLAARPIDVCPTLCVRLYGGGRFAWIDQKLTAVYNGGFSGAVNDIVSSPVYFRGAGVTAGAQAFWKCYHHFGLYGRFTGSLLSGQFRNFLTEANNNGVTPIVDVREKYYQVVPVMELGLGVAWQGEHVRLSVGYELQNWFDMVNSPTFPSPSNIGLPVRRFSDLSLEGLAVQLGVLF
jgi:Legionella pneumophila major outer membrane protein precursor